MAIGIVGEYMRLATSLLSQPKRGKLVLITLYAAVALVWLALMKLALPFIVRDALLLQTLQLFEMWGLLGISVGFLLLASNCPLATTPSNHSVLHLVEEHASDVHMVYNRDRRLSYVNPAAEALCGYTPTEWMAADFADYLHPEDKALMQARFAAAFDGGTGENVEYRLITRDGSIKWMQASWRAVRDEAGTVASVYLHQRDITERKNLEERLEHMHRRVAQSEKMATLGMLVAGVAHELNNPLTSILIHAQLLLQDQSIPHSMRSDLTMIETQTQRASRIVANLLSFARQRKPHRAPTHINDVLNHTLELRGYHLQKQGIHLDVNMASDLPLITADPFQLQQVFLNLVVNAEQALTEHRWSETAPRARPARLKIETSNRYDAASSRWMVVVQITDNGPGIPSAVVNHVFEPFFTTKPEGQGTGLGLSIAAEIVRDHGGQIHIESKPESGTMVEIMLPTTLMHDAKADTVEHVPLPPPGARVLVVYDESKLRDAVARTLSRCGLQIDTVADRSAAFRLLQHTSYDLLICDVDLSEAGNQLPTYDVPASMSDLTPRTIFVAGNAVSAETQALLSRNGRPCLFSPFNAQELLKVAGRVLSA